jgi:Fe2+ transport system protein FeoA
MAEELPLTGVREGERVVVARYCGEAAERLRELGLTVGTELVVGVASGWGGCSKWSFANCGWGCA